MIKNIQLKFFFIFCSLSLLTHKIFSQEWTWIKGANTVNALGVYGTQGVSAGSNLPGSRSSAATWVDNTGNLWMFGGDGHSSATYGRLNDLWKLDPTTHNWTWVKGANATNQSGTYGTLGVAAGANNPGSRALSVTWTDNNGDLWLFGGQGYDLVGANDNLNDLWKYNIASNQWTWMGGSNLVNQLGAYGTQAVASSTNIPGARRFQTGWKDNSGNLWLFGGFGYGSSGGQSNLNDLWKYDPVLNTWTWVKGSTSVDQYGTYGTLGAANALNTPGARYGARTWKDNSGNLYLFGGYGNATSTNGLLNDVWKFNVFTSQWTWVKGSNLINQISVFGTQSIPSSTTTPGGRHFCASWSDSYDNVYIQGGNGISTGGPQQLNDVWKYNSNSNEWTFVRGATYEIAGNYGTQSVTATTSDPGSGYLRMSWKDNSGNFWLFGGYAYDVVANFNVLSELWKMNPCLAPAPANISVYSGQNSCTGSSATLTAVSNTNAVTWYGVSTGGTALGTGTTYISSALTSGTAATASYTYYASATNTCGTSAARTPIVVTSNSIYPVVTTGATYTQSMFIGNIQTINSNWSPAVYNFTDPLPPGAIITGIDLTYDGKDQGFGGTGAPADLHVSDVRVAITALYHNWNPYSTTFTGPISTYVYGGANTFKFYFWGYPAWQGFLNNVNLVFRYQTKTPPPITACQNTSLTLKGYGALTYLWSGGAIDDLPHVLSSTQIYTVTGTNIYGCTNTATQQVNVTPAPTVAIASNTSICQGQTITQTATISGTSHTFSWSTGSTATSISSTPTVSTKYLATAMNTITGCSHVASRKVNVNSAPVLSISASANDFCAGQTTSLALTTNGSAYALNFDGVDDYVETNAAITELGKADFSIEAWIKTTGTSQGIVVCENSNASWDPGEKAFYLDGTGIPTFVGWGNAYIRGNSAVNDGLWHHVAVVWDYSSGTSGVGNIYVDGVDQTGSVTYIANNNNIGTFKIGASNFNGAAEAQNYFSGSIDDVRIWNTSRSASQISINLNSCLSGSESGLVAYYKFENGSGSTNLDDQSTNDNNGVLTNMNSSAAWVAGRSNCVDAFVSYSWLPGALTTSVVSVIPASTTIYSVTVTNNSFCSATAFKTITVNPLPVIAVNNGAICIGNSYTITPTGASTYTFLNGSTIVSPTVTSTYSVAGTSTFGCVSSSPGIASVTVNPLPVLSISGPSAACTGSSISQTVNGANTYSWNTGATSSVIAISPTVITVYNVTGTNSATGCFNSTSKTISIGYAPVISVNSGNVCAGALFTMVPTGASSYTFSSSSGTVLSTVSPTANTSYFVSGTSSLGCVSTSSAISNVIVNAAPVIVVNSGAICAGRVFTMIPTGASTYTFSNGSATVAPFSNTNYTVTGTNVLGCLSIIPAVSAVTVNSLPVISATNATICSGSGFSLNPTGASTYTYTGPSGIVSAWVTPLVNTNYSITGTSAQGCVSSNTAILAVSVASLPVISVSSGTACSGSVYTIIPSGASTYSYSSGASTVIPFSNTSYSVTGTNAQGCVSSGFAVANVTVFATPLVVVNSGTICAGKVFTISPTGASSYTFSSISATVSPISNTSYSVTGTSSVGCVSSNMAVANVVVNPSPSLAVIGNKTICIGGNTSLVATGANTYTWNTNAQGSTQNVSPLTNTTYTVSGTSLNNCTNSETVQVVVNSLPVISLNTGTICPLSSFTIVPTGAVNYTYSGGSNVVSPAVTTSYSVFGTDGNGCTSVLPAITTVTVLNAISMSVSGTTVLCAGQTASFSANGANTYTWSTGVVADNMTTTPVANSIYTVWGASGTCADTAFISVQVNTLPAILANSSSSVICKGESATLTVAGADTYTWSGGETSITVVINPSVTTIYTVTGVDMNGCSNKSTFTQNVAECLGLQSENSGFGLSINLYPNPNTGEFVVEIPTDVKMTVRNSLGQIILENTLYSGTNNVNLGVLANGIYFIEFKNNKQTKTIKVIKQ